MATFTNQATLSYGTNVVNSNIVTGEIVEAVSVSKTALLDTYRADDTITYVVGITNSGVALTGLTVTDDLGANSASGVAVVPSAYADGSLRYYVNGVLQATPTVTPGPPMTVTGINLPAGGNAILVYQVTLNEYASPAEGGTVTNTVNVTGAGITSPVTASETVTAVSEPSLTITKAVNPSTVSDNQPITYTFLVQNYGNQPAAETENAVIRDSFDPILTDLTVTFNGAAWTETTDYTYNTFTGEFTTVAGKITVPAATVTQDPATGAYTVVPGTATLTVTGTV